MTTTTFTDADIEQWTRNGEEAAKEVYSDVPLSHDDAVTTLKAMAELLTIALSIGDAELAASTCGGMCWLGTHTGVKPSEVFANGETDVSKLVTE